MNKQILKYSSAIALFLDSSSAQDSPIGIGGPAPCIESYTGVWSGEETAGDIHFFHGFQAKKDKALVAFGSGHQIAPKGTGRVALIVKMNTDC